MAYNWREFLEFSRELRNDPTNPGPRLAALRSAISRAYYSAFHCALELGEKNGYTRKYTADDHKEIIDYLSVSGNPQFAYLSIYLARLKEKRACVDYDDTLNPNEINFFLYAFSDVDKFFGTYDAIK